MYFQSLFYAAALCATVANADFFVYTEPPIPTSDIPTDPASSSAFITSVGLNALRGYAEFENSAGSTYQSSITSARSEVKAFAASAANYSIPAAVTDDGTTISIFSKPDWYTALPSAARAFKESQVADQFSIVRGVIERGQARSSSSTDGAASVPTPRAGLGAGAGFGAMAAVAVGVFL